MVIPILQHTDGRYYRRVCDIPGANKRLEQSAELRKFEYQILYLSPPICELGATAVVNFQELACPKNSL